MEASVMTSVLKSLLRAVHANAMIAREPKTLATPINIMIKPNSKLTHHSSLSAAETILTVIERSILNTHINTFPAFHVTVDV
jgi:hypothetical protein